MDEHAASFCVLIPPVLENIALLNISLVLLQKQPGGLFSLSIKSTV
jgi:hypothetical protein